MLLNSKWVNERSRRKSKYPETNEKKITTTQNLWDTLQVVLREKFIALPDFLKKQTKRLSQKKKQKSQINNLTLHLKKLEKEQQTTPKVSRRKEKIKIRAEINENRI